MTLTVGTNSYVTQAEADAYLAQSIRAVTAWAALDATTKEAALVSAHRILERHGWLGTKASLPGIASAALNAAGTGYVVGDVLAVSTGSGVSARVKVLTIGGSGEVATFSIEHVGYYSTAPSPLVGAATSGGTGSGCTLDLSMASAQAQEWPRTGISGVTETDTLQPLEDAQCELAFELSQDPSAEAASEAGGDNNKRVKAGSVEVERFAPVRGSRFSRPIMELLAGLSAGAAAGASELGSSHAYGTGAESTFGSETSHDLGKPFY